MIFISLDNNKRRNLFLFPLLVVSSLLSSCAGVDDIDNVVTDIQGTNLGGGLITRTDVEVYADLSLDLRDMRTYDNSAAVVRLYDEGHNAALQAGYKFRLKDLNDLLRDGATLTPNFQFHLYGLSEMSPNSLENYDHYADNFIRSTMSARLALAPEAIVALSMWMYGTHLLSWSVDICAKQSVADNPDALQTLGGGGWDEFIALWIGTDQTPASSTNGHGLYAWAQEIGELFASDTKNGEEVPVNAQLKELYEQGAGLRSIGHACSRENTESVQHLWNIAQQMISKMFIPQFQRLIHAILTQDNDLVALYATALVPQFSQCRPSVYKRLKERLLNGNVNFDKTEELLSDIRQMYSCFGLSCEEIGSYIDDDNDNIHICDADETYAALAGYPPSTDVKELSNIDLDVLQLRILSSMESFSFAQYLYMYGKNSVLPRDSENDPVEFLSLQQLALSNKRRLADPMFSWFEAYFNEENYADKAMLQVLSAGGKWKTVAQRTEVIVATCAYQILFLHFITETNEAVKQCKDADPNAVMADTRLMHPWDEVAALFIGSLEGAREGGSSDQQDGQLLWNLGNSRAFQFQTLNDQGYAEVNSDIVDLLFAGKGEFDALDCISLEYTVRRMQKIAVIPMVQSVIRYAILSDKLSPTSSNNVDLALGETFALAVLPIVAAIDDLAAEVIEENMIYVSGVKPVRDGPQVVAEGLGLVMNHWGVDCRDLGSTSQADPCKNQPQVSPEADVRPASSRRSSASSPVSALSSLRLFSSSAICGLAIVSTVFFVL